MGLESHLRLSKKQSSANIWGDKSNRAGFVKGQPLVMNTDEMDFPSHIKMFSGGANTDLGMKEIFGGKESINYEEEGFQSP